MKLRNVRARQVERFVRRVPADSWLGPATTQRALYRHNKKVAATMRRIYSQTPARVDAPERVRDPRPGRSPAPEQARPDGGA